MGSAAWALTHIRKLPFWFDEVSGKIGNLEKNWTRQFSDIPNASQLTPNGFEMALSSATPRESSA